MTGAPEPDFRGLFDASPNPYLVLDRRLYIVGANRAYLANVRRELADIVDRWAWDAFPGDAETIRQAIASCERVIQTKQTDTMALLRFDVPRPEAEGGGFMQRYWSITHTPVLNAAGEVSLVLQHPIDVTELQHMGTGLEQAGDPSGPMLMPAHSGIFTRAQSVSATNVALQAERDRLGEMFSRAPGFMAVARGREHRIELANRSFMRLVGHRAVIGRTVAEALPELVAQGYIDLLDRAFDSGQAYTASGAMYAVQAAPGAPADERFVDFVVQPIRDAGGQVSGIFVEGADVTERTVGEVALQASEARNRQILDSAIDYAIIATDLHGRVTRWNEGARRVLGWTEAEMLGQTADRFFTPEDVAAGQVCKEMHAALEVGRGPDERWHQRNGGQRFWASGEMTALRDEGGQALGFVKVLRDRTVEHEAQRQREAALLELETERGRLQAVLDNAPIGILVAEAPSGRIVQQNRRAEQIFGHSVIATDAVKEHGRWPVLKPDGQELDVGRYPLVRAIAAGETPSSEEYLCRRGDGCNSWIQLTGSPIRDGMGRITGGVVAIEDIERRKQAEAALQELNATLEQRVVLRTAELAQAQAALVQAQKMEAVGQLTGGLAHDFNNLLTGIAGSLELLHTRIAQGRTKDVDRYINAAQGAAKRAAALTHRLLAFSRQQTLDPKSTNVNRLVTGMEELIRRTVGPEILLETVAATGLWNTLVDPGQLENALLNLCINARDAMPAGGRITVKTGNTWLDERAAHERELAAGPYVTLCVGDTGTGMAREVIARAFDPFFTTKPIGVGTGLGLSMIYGFTRQSGGQVRIQSELGRGTTVCLFLPRHLGAEESVELAPELADAAAAARGETVLVVDDEPTVRMLVVEVLADLGYTAIEAADGAAALKVVHSHGPIDLLVTDVGLPGGMNGRQVADAARTARPGLKVLFITGYAENAVLSHGHLDPGMQVLTKPFAMEALAARIRDLIGAT